MDKIKGMSKRNKIISVIAIIVVIGGFFIWHNQENQLSGTYSAYSGYEHKVTFKGDKVDIKMDENTTHAKYKYDKDTHLITLSDMTGPDKSVMSNKDFILKVSGDKKTITTYTDKDDYSDDTPYISLTKN